MERDDVEALLLLADDARTMPAQRRKSLAQRWQDRLDEDSGGWTRLRLAVLLGNQQDQSAGDLQHARRLLQAYLTDPRDKPPPALRFARFQLNWIEAAQGWHKALRAERQSRHELQQKLDALKAIELRMNQHDDGAKVPLERP